MKLKTKLKNLYRPDWTIGYERDPKKFWLDKNENSDNKLFEISKKILKLINKRAIFSYPNLSPLYKKLSKNLKLSEKRILLTAGSDAGIKTIFEAFVDEHDVVVRTEPTFAMYSVYSKIFNVKEILIEYKKTNYGPQIQLEKLLNVISIKKPKLVCLPNPDSPTGHSFSPKEIEKILEKSKLTNTFVLIDEAYYPFYPHSSINFLKKYNNLIIIRTTSKAWGLAGLRIGYVISSKKIIQEIHKVRPMYEINSIGAEIFKEFLNKKKVVNKSVNRLLKGKLYFKKELKNLGFKTFLKEEGNFIHVNFGKYSRPILNKLNKRFYFRNHESHGSMKNFSRFTITTKKNFSIIIKIIKKIVKKK